MIAPLRRSSTRVVDWIAPQVDVLGRHRSVNIVSRLRTSQQLVVPAIAALLMLVSCGRTELSPEEQDEREIEAMIACQDELGRMLGLPVVALADWEPGMVEYRGRDQYRVRSYLDVGVDTSDLRRVTYTCDAIRLNEEEWRISLPDLRR